MKTDRSGKTLHGIMRYLAKENISVTIVNIDMGAAHSRISLTIQNGIDSKLYDLVHKDSQFWDECAAEFYKIF